MSITRGFCLTKSNSKVLHSFIQPKCFRDLKLFIFVIKLTSTENRLSKSDYLGNIIFNLFHFLTAVFIAEFWYDLGFHDYETQLISGPTFSSGGSFSIHRYHYETVNGHSNWYWGWGLEDHDMSHRLTKNTLEIFQTSKYKRNDQIKDYIKGTSAKWGSQNFVRQDKYGFYKMLNHYFSKQSEYKISL